MKKRTGGLRAEASRAEGAYKHFGSVTQNLGAGAIQLPRACKMTRGSPSGRKHRLGRGDVIEAFIMEQIEV